MNKNNQKQTPDLLEPNQGECESASLSRTPAPDTGNKFDDRLVVDSDDFS